MGRIEESHWHTYITECKTAASGKLMYSTGSAAQCCDNLEGWDGGREGRFKRKGIYVYMWLIHFVV